MKRREKKKTGLHITEHTSNTERHPSKYSFKEKTYPTHLLPLLSHYKNLLPTEFLKKPKKNKKTQKIMFCLFPTITLFNN